MTKDNSGRYASKHPGDQAADPRAVAAVSAAAEKGRLSCASAFKVAEDLSLPAAEIGRTLDLQETKIVKCQLGLFGYQPENRIVEPAEDVPSELEETIRRGLKNGRLPCSEAWRIAAARGLAKLAVAAACEKLEIRIRPCQLGVF